MNYVEMFLRDKQVPTELRFNVRRYLEYCLEVKMVETIEENELMGLLNDNLKSKIIVYLNGGMHYNVKVLN